MNKKKTYQIAGIAILLLIGLKLIDMKIAEEDKNKKTIYIDVQSATQDVHMKHTSEASTLLELLQEEGFDVEIKEGVYGAYLESFRGEAQNMEEGPWWVYSSENNQDCVSQGMCPSLDQVHLKDKDKFFFSLTSDIY